MSRDLSRLLRPDSIAVVGGGTWCANVIEQCRKIGFGGELFAVHPSRTEIGGVAAVATVADLPKAPDAVFVGVNRDATVDVVAALATRGAGGAVCFASGFAEAAQQIDGSGDLQAALVSAAGEMPILGPNCYGLLNLVDRAALWPDQHGAVPVARGVAIVAQSSNIAINLTMQRRGLPLAYVVTAGNGAQTDLCDIGAALLADDRVTALGLHMEGIDGPDRLEALAAVARASNKPVVALKVGRTEAARTAALSHTASLAGGTAGSDALLDRLGIMRVAGPSSFIEALKILHQTGPLASRRVASMSCSGGEAALVADASAQAGLTCPALSSDQTVRLRAVLGPQVALANPLDYHTQIWNDRAAMAETFAAMLSGDVAAGVVVLDFPRADRCDPALWQTAIDAAADARRSVGKPLAILSTLVDTMDEATAEAIAARGLVPLNGLEEGLAALAACAPVGACDDAPVLRPRRPARPRVLTEAEAKAKLAAFGLSVPRSERARTAAEAADAAARIGWPVVLKGEGVAHKTEAGAVRVGLESAPAVRDAAHDMVCESYLVEEMVGDSVAELLVGVVLDPAHGYVLTLAAGGTLTELLSDRTSLLIPSTREEIDAALSRLRIAALLDGWRGGVAAARGPILDAVMAVQAFVVAHHGAIEEVEVNPLICRPRDAVAVDALIRMEDP